MAALFPASAALAACLVLVPNNSAHTRHTWRKSEGRNLGGLEWALGGLESMHPAAERHCAFIAPFPGKLGPLHLVQSKLKLRTAVVRSLRVGSTSLLHVRCLNRLLVDPWEVQEDGPGKIAVVLPPDDGRVKHVKKILKSDDGNTLRIGVVDAGTEEDAVVQWQVRCVCVHRRL